ncbi:hypothetical protein SCHPADRAFT_1003268 [Schizopora paradoxa]|uniref:Uncharacterized protein n=1 Tax=Schizopora paradoxa TaxID=27342 RepID=A0A0H2QYS6_9AGAM|nr:hypothetical protein SCHPADRAFT_1003268 [Schizopora paradoxa]
MSSSININTITIKPKFEFVTNHPTSKSIECSSYGLFTDGFRDGERDGERDPGHIKVVVESYHDHYSIVVYKGDGSFDSNWKKKLRLDSSEEWVITLNQEAELVIVSEGTKKWFFRFSDANATRFFALQMKTIHAFYYQGDEIVPSYTVN